MREQPGAMKSGAQLVDFRTMMSATVQHLTYLAGKLQVECPYMFGLLLRCCQFASLVPPGKTLQQIHLEMYITSRRAWYKSTHQ